MKHRSSLTCQQAEEGYFPTHRVSEGKGSDNTVLLVPRHGSSQVTNPAQPKYRGKDRNRGGRQSTKMGDEKLG